MPQDNRRFNGPEDSVSYLKYTKDNVKPYDELHADLLDDNQLRKDGRTLDEGRSMCMSCMYLSNFGFNFGVAFCYATKKLLIQ